MDGGRFDWKKINDMDSSQVQQSLLAKFHTGTKITMRLLTTSVKTANGTRLNKSLQFKGKIVLFLINIRTQRKSFEDVLMSPILDLTQKLKHFLKHKAYFEISTLSHKKLLFFISYFYN